MGQKEWNDKYGKSEKGKKTIYESTKRWRLKNRAKFLAHSQVRYAVKIGKLAKQSCEVCGKPFAYAHHDDYSKPLEVRWLCQKHHMEHHKNLRSLQATGSHKSQGLL